MLEIKLSLGKCLQDLDAAKENIKLLLEAVAKKSDYDFSSDSFAEDLKYLGLTREQFGEFYGRYPFPRKTGSDAWGNVGGE